MPTGPAEIAAIRQRITTFKQLFTRKETRVLATKCTGHESIPKAMLQDMDEKVIEILELSNQLVIVDSSKTSQEAVDALDKDLTARQIRCEAWINGLPVELPGGSTPVTTRSSSTPQRQFKEQVGLRPGKLDLTTSMMEMKNSAHIMPRQTWTC